MSSTIHGRDQIDYVKVGAKRDGTITGLDVRAICDLGAYYTLLTPFIPCFTGFVISGCYKIPNLNFTAVGVFTNKMATDATRGAGRPEATHLIEVTIEQLAAELGLDPLEVPRKNFIPKEDFPAEVALGLVYDSGDYHGSLDKLLTHVDVDAFRREQAELRERGIYRGIGFSTWMEICGLAPSRVVGPSGVGLQAGFYESSIVRVHASGSVTAYSGTAPHGQGLDTSFAQIVADRVGDDARRRRRDARRHRHRPVRPRHLRLALARRRRRVARRARRSRWPTRPSGSPRTCSRRRRRTSSSRTASTRSAARRTRA